VNKITNEILKKVFEDKENVLLTNNEENKKLNILELIKEKNGIYAKELEKIVNMEDFVKISELCTFKDDKVYLNEAGEEEIRILKGEFRDIVEKIKNEIEKVNFYPPRTNEDVGYYKIWIKGKIIEISIEKLMSPRYFCAMYYDRFKKYIKISNKGEDSEWAAILDYLGEKSIVKDPDYIDSEQFIVDEIISRLQDCVITKDIEKVVNMWNYIYLNNNELYYPSFNIKKIIKNARFGIKLRRLRSLLNPYLIGNTTVKRVGDKTIRFWVFDPYTLQIDINAKLEKNEEKEEVDKDVE